MSLVLPAMRGPPLQTHKAATEKVAAGAERRIGCESTNNNQQWEPVLSQNAAFSYQKTAVFGSPRIYDLERACTNM